jgi:hypothetical protein
MVWSFSRHDNNFRSSVITSDFRCQILPKQMPYSVRNIGLNFEQAVTSLIRIKCNGKMLEHIARE